MANEADRAFRRAWSLFLAANQCGNCWNPIFISPKDYSGGDEGQTIEHYGMTYAIRCGSRLAEVCPPCSRLYSMDAKRLVSLGLTGAENLVSLTVSENSRLFITLTLPSFGRVHHVLKRRGHLGQCHPGKKEHCRHGTRITCNKIHEKDDPDVGTPLCPDCYALDDQILANATVTELWDRFRDHELPRELAKVLGIERDEFGDYLRVEAIKTAESQARLAIHFHGFIRLDGPSGQGSRLKMKVTDAQLVKAVQRAAKKVVIHKRFAISDTDPGAIERDFRFGEQVDVFVINELNQKFFAGYVSKYATKAATDSQGFAHTFRDLDQIDTLPDSAWWPRTLARTAWKLGGDPRFASLKLRLHANTFGFRGHFLTKSRYWSVTFVQLKEIRVKWAIEHRDPKHPPLSNVPLSLFLNKSVKWGVAAFGWLNDRDLEVVHAWSRVEEEFRTNERERQREWREHLRESEAA